MHRSKVASCLRNYIAVELVNSCCLACITYACEALIFNKTDDNILDNLINRALRKIFSVHIIIIEQEAQLLLGDRATRKHAKDC